MKINKIKRYELCYVNRLLLEESIFFDDLISILDFVDDFNCNIAYVKYCYDFKKHQFIYNYLSFDRKV